MSLRIHSLKNHGDEKSESISMEVLEDCDLNGFAVLDTTYQSGGGVSNAWRHFYWFGVQAVKKGDFVVLWTAPGKDRERDFERSDTKKIVKVYDRYWGMDSPVWNDGGDCAAVLRVSVVASKKKKG